MNEQKIKGKRILFFSPAFFSYENTIAERMRALGAEVTLYDERAVKGAISRALLKFVPALFKRKAEKYYEQIVWQHSTEVYDYVLIVKCDMVSEQTINLLRHTYPGAKLCLHVWDSLDNIPGIEEKINLFDYASSFDRKDCLEDTRLHFRPLFFSKEFERNDSKKEYDIAFCGTIHSDRYAIVKKVKKWCEENGRLFYSFPYLQSKFVFYFYRLVNKSFRGTTINDFAYTKKTQTEIAQIEASSSVILDIQHPAQTGLTMRTIEMIGLGKKIITTNSDIINYDLYRQSNVCVIERENISIPDEFISSDYEPLEESIREKYSLDCWIFDVLGV